MFAPDLQIHSAVSDGDGPVQASENAEAVQRPHLLLSIPDPARSEIHSQQQRAASRSEAVEPAAEHDL